MKIPIFAAAIRKCDAVLKPRGVDIFRILTEKDPKMFDYIINAFVGITAVQVIFHISVYNFEVAAQIVLHRYITDIGCFSKILISSKRCSS